MGAVAHLADYAEARRQARLHERHRGVTSAPTRTDLPGVELVTRSHAFGIGLDGGSDWFDVLPLADDALAVVIGEAPGRGVEAAALKADLRVVTQAATLTSAGQSPADVVSVLDRWTSLGRGAGATVAVVLLQPSTGRLRLCTAGHCPPLVLSKVGARYLHEDFTPAIGQAGRRNRAEEVTRLDGGDVLLSFTDGLVEHPNKPLAFGLLQLREAATSGPEKLDDLCSYLVATCVDRRRRKDDHFLLGLRLTP